MKSLGAPKGLLLRGLALECRRLPWLALAAVLFLGLSNPAFAHGTKTPHTLVLAQVEVTGESLHVSVWVERPVARVVQDFTKNFAHDRQRAAEQEEQFREAQWARLAGEISVTANGTPLETEWKPVDLANNGRGDERKFIYSIETAIPLASVLAEGAVDRLVVEIDNQVLLGEPHVFLSSYTEVESPWSVETNSHDDLRAGGKTASGMAGGETTWTHDVRARTWRLVFTRAR